MVDAVPGFTFGITARPDWSRQEGDMVVRIGSIVVSSIAAMFAAATALLVVVDGADAGSAGGAAANAGSRTSMGGASLPTSQGGLGTASQSNKNGSATTNSTDFKKSPLTNWTGDAVKRDTGATTASKSSQTTKKVWEYIRKNNLQDRAKRD
jgi:hypothetical protein